MYSLGLLGFSSFLLALGFTPLWRHLFGRWGMVDHPDGGRHLHTYPTPRCGGIPILCAYLGAFLFWLLLPLSAVGMAASGLSLAGRLAPAVALIFAVGLIDDVRGLKPWQKFAGQFGASGLAYAGGVQVTSMVWLNLPVWLSLPVTLLWLVGCCNAFNLIDGIDGLAAGAGLFATITILAGALLHHNLPLALLTMPLAGALLGFLWYNFNPASIFLGDSGALTLGFLLGCYGVIWGQKSTTILGMTAPMMALALPLLDTALAIVRRFLRQQPMFVGDLAHIHHRLLAHGLTTRRAALLLYAACGVAAVMSLLASIARDHLKGGLLLVFCAITWAGIHHLRYAEFKVMGSMLWDGAFRRHLNHTLTVQAVKEKLARAQTTEDLWGAVCEACPKFGFIHAELWLDGCHFTKTFDGMNQSDTWDLEIPLCNRGYLHLKRCFGEAKVPTVLVPFAEALHDNFPGNMFSSQLRGGQTRLQDLAKKGEGKQGPMAAKTQRAA